METIEDIKSKYLNTVDNADILKKDSVNITAETRNRLAIMFIKLYFATLALSFIIPWSFNLCIYLLTGDNQLFLSIKEIVLLITSTLGGPLGFVIAFYFKNDK